MKNNETPLDEELLREAIDAFWDVITDHYPQAETGDLSPQRTLAFWNAGSEAVQEWIKNNVRKICKTCGSEIVETVNNSLFGDGECGGCEYRRYKSQPGLLTALTSARDGIVGVKMLLPRGSDKYKRFQQLLTVIETAFANAYGDAA